MCCHTTENSDYSLHYSALRANPIFACRLSVISIWKKPTNSVISQFRLISMLRIPLSTWWVFYDVIKLGCRTFYVLNYIIHDLFKLIWNGLYRYRKTVCVLRRMWSFVGFYFLRPLQDGCWLCEYLRYSNTIHE